METDAPGSETKKPTTTQDVDATEKPTIKKELVSTGTIVSTVLHSRFLFAFIFFLHVCLEITMNQ